jgi:hypothetical protein
MGNALKGASKDFADCCEPMSSKTLRVVEALPMKSAKGLGDERERAGSSQVLAVDDFLDD